MGAAAQQKDKRRAERARGALEKKRDEVVRLTADLENKKQAAADAAARAAAAAAAAARREEATRAMTDAGLGLFLDIRISYQGRFDNSSDDSKSIWARIKAEYDKS